MEIALHSQQPDHDALIERAKQGDADAFGALYALYKRKTFSLCLRMVNNTAEAEDLVQECFLQLHRKLGTFRGESQFSTWFHRLSINVVLMSVRKKRINLVSLDDMAEPTEGEIPHHLGSPDHHLEVSVERLALERAITELPPGYRLVFILHDVEGYEHNEIASLLGCSIGNSKSQLFKARTKLLEVLKIKIDPLSVLANFGKFLADEGEEQA